MLRVIMVHLTRFDLFLFQQEQTTKIVAVEGPTRYVSVSRVSSCRIHIQTKKKQPPAQIFLRTCVLKLYSCTPDKEICGFSLG